MVLVKLNEIYNKIMLWIWKRNRKKEDLIGVERWEREERVIRRVGGWVCIKFVRVLNKFFKVNYFLKVFY